MRVRTGRASQSLKLSRLNFLRRILFPPASSPTTWNVLLDRSTQTVTMADSVVIFGFFGVSTFIPIVVYFLVDIHTGDRAALQDKIKDLRKNPGDLWRNPAGRSASIERSGTTGYSGLSSGGFWPGSAVQQCPGKNGVCRFRAEDQCSGSVRCQRSGRAPADPAEIQEKPHSHRSGGVSGEGDPPGRPAQHRNCKPGTPRANSARERTNRSRKGATVAKEASAPSPIGEVSA